MKSNNEMVNELYSADVIYYVINVGTRSPHHFDGDTIMVSSKSHFASRVIHEEEYNHYLLTVDAVANESIGAFFATAADNGVCRVGIDTGRGVKILPIQMLLRSGDICQNDRQSAEFAAVLTCLVQESQRIHEQSEGILDRERQLLATLRKMSLHTDIFCPLVRDDPGLVDGVRTVTVIQFKGLGSAYDNCDFMPLFTSTRLGEKMNQLTSPNDSDEEQPWWGYAKLPLLQQLLAYTRFVMEQDKRGQKPYRLIINPGTLNWIITPTFIREVMEEAKKDC